MQLNLFDQLLSNLSEKYKHFSYFCASGNSKNTMLPVYITRLSKFLPNKPIHNDEMEKYLGLVDGKPSKARAVILRNNKIHTRYYSYDEQGNSTHSNARMAAEAVKLILNDSFRLEDIQLLACGTSSPDQTLPSHASMVHGDLGGKPIEIISTAGSCASGMHAMKFAFLSIASGERKNGVCVGSEKFSASLLARNFNKEAEKLHLLLDNPIIAFEKDFLRWMLSDGAGAALLENRPDPRKHSLKIEWIESLSYANELETCMYAGCDKLENGEIKGYREFEADDLIGKSIMSVRQDVRLLDVHIVRKGGQFLREIADKRALDINSIDYFLPHISSEYFRSRIAGELESLGLGIPQEKWFTNLASLGNVGAASIYFMLEELFNSDTLVKGQKLLLMIPESARFSYVFSLMTVV